MNKEKFKSLYYEKHWDFVVSLVPSLLMGSLHLALSIAHFSWITISYTAFCYLTAFTKVVLYIDNKNKRPLYFRSAIYFSLLLIPLVSSMLMTIFYKDADTYLFFWVPIAYAIYGVAKLAYAMVSLSKKKSEEDYLKIKARLSLVGAMFTLQMMQFKLIRMNSSEVDSSMHVMEIFTQIAIALITLAIIVSFICKGICESKKHSISP